MTLRSTGELQNPNGLKDIVTELQGLSIDVINGAAAASKMDVAALRKEDTLLQAMVMLDTFAAPVSDLANLTIVETHALGTLTISGDPVDDEVFVVNDVTYTFKTTPTAMTHVKITAGDNTAMAAAVSSAVNSYENRRVDGIGAGSGNYNSPQVSASPAAGVVTFTSVGDGAGNGPVVTDIGTTITISNADPAAVTATFVSAADTDAVVVNGVTFTIRTTPVDADLDMPVEADDTLQAAELVRAVGAYEQKFGTLDVALSNVLGVVTITPLTAKKGNIITLTETATNVAVSGSGLLAGGTATGGVTSTTDLSVATLLLAWFNKNP